MTTVRLFKDIGLDPSFKKTIDFTSKTAQSNWFASKNYKEYDNVNFNKPQNLLKINDMDISEAVNYTYCALIDLDSQDLRTYYYFINSATVVGTNTIAFELMPDYIQTYMCEFELGECLVNREHVDRWGESEHIPIRVTPNAEGIIANQIFQQSVRLVKEGNNFALVSLVFTSPKFTVNDEEVDLTNRLFYGVFPVDLENYDRRIPTKYKLTLTIGENTASADYPSYFPSINDIINGNFQDLLPVTPDSQISMSMTPICGCDITIETGGYCYVCQNGLSGTIPELDITLSSTGAVIGLGDIVINKLEAIPVGQKILEASNMSMQVFTAEQMYDNRAGIAVTRAAIARPRRPTNGAIESTAFEPALYMSPYISRYIMTEKGEMVMTIPDEVAFGETLTFHCKNLFTSGGIVNLISIGNYDENNPARLASIGAQTTHICPAIDIISDSWKTYAMTKRDTDRQAVTNENWRNGINNVLFMGYGGALVGSRSASGSIDDDDRRNRLLNSGAISAIGIATGAAVVASLVDAHYSWQSQLLKEKQIQNEPSILLQAGEGIQTLIDGSANYTLVVTRVDDVNWNKAYDNFRKYGYMVNIFEKPNIRSRKYFNYILTNGAIINGSLNADIKKQISRIFDCGITIFHGDYQTNLEYPEYENIERSLI